MNVESKSYRSPTRMQLRDSRFHREDLAHKFVDAMADIKCIQAAARGEKHIDPLEHVGSLKEKSAELFTKIPDEFKYQGEKGKKLSAQYKSTESRLKPVLSANESWYSTLSERPQHRPPTHEAVVSSKKPLMLSWDAERALTNQKPGGKENKAQSVYCGLFSQNGAGAAPVYAPPEDNPRVQAQKKREAKLKKFIPVDKSRKAKILEVKPLPKPSKVDASFVPNCASRVDNSSGVERKQDIERRTAMEHKRHAGAKPFR